MKNNFMSLIVNILFALFLSINASVAGEIPQTVFTINNSTLGVTTLDEVRKMYGVADAYRVSRDDEADIAVCYTHPSTKEKYFLIFESSVMGSYKQITGFRLSKLHPSTNCLHTTSDIGSLATGNGAHLGQRLNDFLKTFPFKFERRNSELLFETIRQRKATEEELKKIRSAWPDEKQDSFDITITIRAKFKKDRLIDLYIQKIESY